MSTQSNSDHREYDTMDAYIIVLALALLLLTIISFASLNRPPRKDETQVSISSTRTINISVPVAQAWTKGRICNRGDNKTVKSKSNTLG